MDTTDNEKELKLEGTAVVPGPYGGNVLLVNVGDSMGDDIGKDDSEVEGDVIPLDANMMVPVVLVSPPPSLLLAVLTEMQIEPVQLILGPTGVVTFGVEVLVPVTGVVGTPE